MTVPLALVEVVCSVSPMIDPLRDSGGICCHIRNNRSVIVPFYLYLEGSESSIACPSQKFHLLLNKKIYLFKKYCKYRTNVLKLFSKHS